MSRARADVVVIGGGVAGLWIRAALARAGWSVVLLESRALGHGQTAASQGILHRGVKYALSTEAREASGQLAAAQEAWRSALGLRPGEPGIDLRGTRVVADRMHLWAVGLLDKATGAGAALAMRSEVKRLTREEFPPAFRGAPGAVAVWEVDEISVSVPSLLDRLVGAPGGPVLKTAAPAVVTDGGVPHVEAFGDDGRRVTIEARAVVLAAGEGNEALLAGLGHEGWMQRRPLHMVMADGAPVPLQAHLPRAGSDKPRLTVTSDRTPRGWCWYIGGDVAETGVDRSRSEQIEFAQREVGAVLGWLDLSRARWATLRIDRAEGRSASGRRPDGPVVRRAGRVIAVWPTKLALAPAAADRVELELGEIGVGRSPGEFGELAAWPGPGVEAAPWSGGGVEWS